jgi:hypothetical protein
MAKKYFIDNIEFKGEAYKKDKKRVLNHTTCGVITLPVWMIGKEFDIILIPRKDEKENNQSEIIETEKI